MIRNGKIGILCLLLLAGNAAWGQTGGGCLGDFPVTDNTSNGTYETGTIVSVNKKKTKLQPHVPKYELMRVIKDTAILRVLNSEKQVTGHNCSNTVSRMILISLNPDTVISSNDTIKVLLNKYPFLKIALESGADITKIKQVNVDATGVIFSKIETTGDNIITAIRNDFSLERKKILYQQSVGNIKLITGKLYAEQGSSLSFMTQSKTDIKLTKALRYNPKDSVKHTVKYSDSVAIGYLLEDVISRKELKQMIRETGDGDFKKRGKIFVPFGINQFSDESGYKYSWIGKTAGIITAAGLLTDIVAAGMILNDSNYKYRMNKQPEKAMIIWGTIATIAGFSINSVVNFHQVKERKKNHQSSINIIPAITSEYGKISLTYNF